MNENLQLPQLNGQSVIPTDLYRHYYQDEFKEKGSWRIRKRLHIEDPSLGDGKYEIMPETMFMLRTIFYYDNGMDRQLVIMLCIREDEPAFYKFAGTISTRQIRDTNLDNLEGATEIHHDDFMDQYLKDDYGPSFFERFEKNDPEILQYLVDRGLLMLVDDEEAVHIIRTFNLVVEDWKIGDWAKNDNRSVASKISPFLFDVVPDDFITFPMEQSDPDQFAGTIFTLPKGSHLAPVNLKDWKFNSKETIINSCMIQDVHGMNWLVCVTYNLRSQKCQCELLMQAISPKWGFFCPNKETMDRITTLLVENGHLRVTLDSESTKKEIVGFKTNYYKQNPKSPKEVSFNKSGFLKETEAFIKVHRW